MPSIKQNAEFFQRAKELGAIEPIQRDVQQNVQINTARIPNIPTYPSEPNPRLRSPMPANLVLQPDSTRQFFNPSTPQSRLMLPTPASSAYLGAAIQSISGSNAVTPTIPLQPPVSQSQLFEINADGNFEQIVTINGLPV